MDGAPFLARHGLLGRFDAGEEAGYQRWLRLRIRTLGATMGAASIVTWLIIPVAGHLTLPPESDIRVLYLVCWGVFLPVLAVSVIYSVRSTSQRWFVVGAIACVSVTALGSLLVIGPALNVDSWVYLGTATFFGMLAPMVLLSFRVCSVIGASVAAAGTYQAIATQQGDWDPSMWIMAIGMLVATLLLAPAMAFASERWLRTGFANERLIAHQRQLIRRYAPSAVVARIEHGDSTVDQPQRRRVTVFFSDVVGFTAMADRVDPEALAEIVNDYLGELSELIERHRGTLNEFAGDGVMAIFGAPDELDPADQVHAALAAARELQRSLPSWSQSWFEHGILEEARARIGINTGTVSVGTFGSTVRATYTGIGLQTNIAARVQAEAPPGGILLSNTSWHLVKDTIPCEPRGEVMVKGVHFPIGLYSPSE